ncbi:hypothetical protein F66182_7774 [Fusarium sp. NRRL 66182]|nr:hypothetical protein F66182_7774 [Fusarium sp. NRRL 66182]
MAQSNNERKVVVVIGATGLQGGSVVRTLSEARHKYIIRGLSRDVSSSKAQALSKMGIEMRKVDLDDPESFHDAFEGAQIIFAMTDFWQTMSAAREEAQGKSIMDIAADLPDLEQMIWADLPDAARISGGKYINVHHWQSKAAISDYIRVEKPDLWKKTTTVLFPNYFENCLTNPADVRENQQPDGTYQRSFVLPEETLLPNVAISDTGKLVQYIIEHPDLCISKTIAFYSQAISEGAKIQSMVSGKQSRSVARTNFRSRYDSGTTDLLAPAYNIDVRYNLVSSKEFQSNLKKTMDDVTALDFTEQLLIFRDFGQIYGRSEFVQVSQLPGLELMTWEAFLAANNLLSYMTSK